MKAALRSIAIEYPKEHEVSDLLFEFRDRLPDWFQAEIASIQEASISLFKKRELAFYGGEALALPPDKVIDEADGRKAVESAERVHSDCERLLKEVAPDPSPTRNRSRR